VAGDLNRKRSWWIEPAAWAAFDFEAVDAGDRR
jgi:hypothetical protein